MRGKKSRSYALAATMVCLLGAAIAVPGNAAKASTSEPGNTGRVIAGLIAVSTDGTVAVGADSISTFLAPLCGSALAEARTPAGWAARKTPSPSCGMLTSVLTLPKHRAWAVGYQVTSAGHVRTLAEFYNGSKWAIEPTPNPLAAGNDYIVSVTIDKSGTLWAVGQTVPSNLNPPTSLILKYSHGKWVNVPVSFHIVLEGVTVSSTGQVWAVGQQFSGEDLNYDSAIIELTGGTWKLVPSPSPGGFDGTFVNAIAAGPHGALWAVGDYNSPGTGAPHTLMLRYAGGRWTQVPSPSPGAKGDLLYSAAIAGNGQAYATGGYTDSKCQHALAEHFANGKWTLLHPLDPGKCTSSNATVLYGVTVTGNVVYAVGQSDISSLAEQYAGGKWKVLKSAN
jgi:hypothetical protein